MVAVSVILYVNGSLDGRDAVWLSVLLNLVGYLKYLYQMLVNPEYITLSFHVYNAAWLAVAIIEGDPLYYLLFRYPFSALIAIENYVDLRGRKILFDEHSISIHCVDHLLHGMISLRILGYFFYGFTFVASDFVVVPFILLLSQSLVKLQMRVSPSKAG